MDRAVRPRDEVERREDDLVTLLDAERYHPKVQAGRARTESGRAYDADVGRHHLLELLRSRTDGQPSGPERLDDLGYLLLADGRERERKEALPDGFAALNRR